MYILFPKYTPVLENTFNQSNIITMMYETDVGSNEYQISSDNSWPSEGYVFNETLSYCKNGSKIIWNEETKSVSLKTGITDSCNIYFDKYAFPVITEVLVSEVTDKSITVSVEVELGDNAVSSYYYRINEEEYVASNSNTYTFSNLVANTEYNIDIYVIDTNNVSSNVYSLTSTTSNPTYIADYIIEELYTGDGNNGLYYHDGSGAYTNANLETGDNSYRYSGANPNNYVCFGSDEESCPDANLYRIIGIFDNQIKLIKSTNLGNNVWNSINSNVWSNASLNNNVLNSSYLNGIAERYRNMIDDADWHVDGVIWTTPNGNALNAYNSEIANSSTTINKKVGLLYLSYY